MTRQEAIELIRELTPDEKARLFELLLSMRREAEPAAREPETASPGTD